MDILTRSGISDISTFHYVADDEAAESPSGPTVSVGWLKAALADIPDDLPVAFGIPQSGELALNIIPLGGAIFDFRGVNLMTLRDMDAFRARMDEVTP